MTEAETRAAPAWSATEITNIAGLPPRLSVEGHVEAQVTDVPKLLVRHPQGINPKVLMLDLVVESGPGPGSHAMEERPVSYAQEVSSHQYTEVEVFRDGKRLAVMQVRQAVG